MAADPSLRVLGVSVADVSDYRAPRPEGKWSQFYGALARRVPVVDVVRPRVSRREVALSLARSIRPDRAAWRARASVHPRLVARLDRALASELVARRDAYDLIVQLQTLCSPRVPGLDAPYVIYTDNTLALTHRTYPAYFPLAPRAMATRLRFEADICRGARFVFTFSRFARRSVIEDYGCAPEKVVAVGAGANQLLPSLGARAHGQRRALFVGSPFALKGGHHLLRAWRLVRERVPDAELVLVGPRRDPAPGFGHGVSWRGRVNRSELDRLYRSATVFVLPSMFDAWGHVFVEAMGYGLPCIGTDCCAMPELIEEGVSGRLVPRGAAEPLADALVELLTSPELAATMGRAGHERVRRELTWDRVVDRVLAPLASPGDQGSGIVRLRR